jgi:hypothetical protein
MYYENIIIWKNFLNSSPIALELTLLLSLKKQRNGKLKYRIKEIKSG